MTCTEAKRSRLNEDDNVLYVIKKRVSDCSLRLNYQLYSNIMTTSNKINLQSKIMTDYQLNSDSF